MVVIISYSVFMTEYG